MTAGPNLRWRGTLSCRTKCGTCEEVNDVKRATSMRCMFQHVFCVETPTIRQNSSGRGRNDKSSLGRRT
jgi:hypothetical protein